MVGDSSHTHINTDNSSSTNLLKKKTDKSLGFYASNVLPYVYNSEGYILLMDQCGTNKETKKYLVISNKGHEYTKDNAKDAILENNINKLDIKEPMLIKHKDAIFYVVECVYSKNGDSTIIPENQTEFITEFLLDSIKNDITVVDPAKLDKDNGSDVYNAALVNIGIEQDSFPNIKKVHSQWRLGRMLQGSRDIYTSLKAENIDLPRSIANKQINDKEQPGKHRVTVISDPLYINGQLTENQRNEGKFVFMLENTFWVDNNKTEKQKFEIIKNKLEEINKKALSVNQYFQSIKSLSRVSKKHRDLLASFTNKSKTANSIDHQCVKMKMDNDNNLHIMDLKSKTVQKGRLYDSKDHKINLSNVRKTGEDSEFVTRIKQTFDAALRFNDETKLRKSNKLSLMFPEFNTPPEVLGEGKRGNKLLEFDNKTNTKLGKSSGIIDLPEAKHSYYITISCTKNLTNPQDTKKDEFINDNSIGSPLYLIETALKDAISTRKLAHISNNADRSRFMNKFINESIVDSYATDLPQLSNPISPNLRKLREKRDLEYKNAKAFLYNGDFIHNGKVINFEIMVTKTNKDMRPKPLQAKQKPKQNKV